MRPALVLSSMYAKLKPKVMPTARVRMNFLGMKAPELEESETGRKGKSYNKLRKKAMFIHIKVNKKQPIPRR